MAEKLNQILVIDLESTCWEKEDKTHQESEIIEIGLTLIGVATPSSRYGKESILVKPTKTEINEFCTKLTTLTPEKVEEDGIPFSEACQYLKNFHRSKKVTWASWGDYDRRQFERQCKRENIPYPFGPTHLNVKNLFALVKELGRECGMSEALQRLEMPLEGRHHRGIDDAWNIAAILCNILNSTRFNL